MRKEQYPAKGTGVQRLSTELHGTPERIGCHVIQPKADVNKEKAMGRRQEIKMRLHLIVKGSSGMSLFYSTGN